jgi:hypothetical protein
VIAGLEEVLAIALRAVEGKKDAGILEDIYRQDEDWGYNAREGKRARLTDVPVQTQTNHQAACTDCLYMSVQVCTGSTDTNVPVQTQTNHPLKISSCAVVSDQRYVR